MKKNRFYIEINQTQFVKGDILVIGPNTQAKIIKTYTFNFKL